MIIGLLVVIIIILMLVRIILTRKSIKKLQNKILRLENSLKKYKKYSWYDVLTDLFNKRKLKRDLKRLYYDYKRYRHRFTAVMIDIDGFKNINDTYGHAEGDKYLIELAKVIKRCIRRTDRAYRPSGDEFIILLPNSNSKTAKEVIKRIKEMSYTSISYGISTNREPKILLEEIDKKMYEDKKRKKEGDLDE